MKSSKWGIPWVVLLAGVLPIALGAACINVLPGVKWTQLPIHSLMEALGLFTGISLAIILLQQRRRADILYYVWIAAALISMGILDGFHASVSAGNSFVWLHSTALLAGGFLFALVWWPLARNTQSRVAGLLPSVVAAIVMALGIFSLGFPQALPAMLVEGSFTMTASTMNVLGGIFFLVGAVYFFAHYQTGKNSADIFFAFLCLLNGSAGILFPFTVPWQAAWWLWHMLRLIAYIVVLVYAFTTFRHSITELQKSQDEIALILNTASGGIRLIDTDFNMIRSNAAMATLIGLPPEAISGKKCFDVFKGELCHTKDCPIASIQEAKTSLKREVVKHRQDGTEVICSLTASPLFNEHGKFTGILEDFVDITDAKQAEDRLRETLADLERSNAELERFVYIASHDLQEPLRMVSSYTQLLEKRYKDKLDDDAHDFIQYAVDGAKRMQQLINDLLAYSRVGTHGKPFEPTSSEAVFDAAVTNLDVAIRESGAVVTHDPLPKVKADEGQLVQLFQNLVGNAIKFHGKQPPRVHVSAKPDGDKWVFSVQDNGIGIDLQYFDRVFIVFQRLHGKDSPGTGIGLSISKSIVERHGGRIWIDSQPGKGSIFYFTIPNKGV